MKVILIAGTSGSGKTLLGKKIVEYAKTKGLRAIQTEYSKYLKMYAQEILGDNLTIKPRKFLQEEGSYIRYTLKDEHFFTKRMLEDFRIYEKYADIVVISDVRLKTEIIDMQKSKYSCLTIQVLSKRKNNLTKEEQEHITERELINYPNFDYSIWNENNSVLTKYAQEIIEREVLS